ncbi:MAG: hypothetical protein ACP5Q3_16365 [bacterium]
MENKELATLPRNNGRLARHDEKVGQAFMACQIQQGPSPCPTAAASFHGRITAS